MGIYNALVASGVQNIHEGDKGDVVLEIQQRLRLDGQELLTDSEFGPITRSAVERFQASHHLNAVGYVGPRTAMTLDAVSGHVVLPHPLPSVRAVAPHLATMRAITGTRELPGAADSAIILAWRKVIAAAYQEMAPYAMSYTHDSIPWCGYCVAYCLAANKLRPVFGATDTKRFLWADAWGHEGPELIRLKPPYPVGAILTFTRAGGGHVSTLEGETSDSFIIRGGNQSDMVNVVTKSKAQFSAATWPRALPIPAYVKPPTTLAGAVAAGREA